MPAAKKTIQQQTAISPDLVKVRQKFKNMIKAQEDPRANQTFTNLSFQDDPDKENKELYQLNLSGILPSSLSSIKEFNEELDLMVGESTPKEDQNLQVI